MAQREGRRTASGHVEEATREPAAVTGSQAPAAGTQPGPAERAEAGPSMCSLSFEWQHCFLGKGECPPQSRVKERDPVLSFLEYSEINQPQHSPEPKQTSQGFPM